MFDGRVSVDFDERRVGLVVARLPDPLVTVPLPVTAHEDVALAVAVVLDEERRAITVVVVVRADHRARHPDVRARVTAVVVVARLAPPAAFLDDHATAAVPAAVLVFLALSLVTVAFTLFTAVVAAFFVIYLSSCRLSSSPVASATVSAVRN